MDMSKRRVTPCKDMDFFERPGESSPGFEKRAKQDLVPICGACAIQADCLLFALENNYDVGVWGATTPAQRKELRRRGVQRIAR